MPDIYDHLPFLDELTPEEQKALRAALAEDESLAEVYVRWLQVHAAIREQLDLALPDRHYCMLYGIEAAGQAGILSDDERRALDLARSQFEAALQRHPGLPYIVQDVQQACDDFDAAWEEHASAQAPDVQRREADRKALHRVHRRPPLHRWGWRALAAAAVLIFGIVSVLMLQRDAGMRTIQAAEGAMRVIELADGSTVRLLGGSSLTYAAPDDAGAFSRRVRLDGRAFFDIVADQQGFTVETATAVTTVLGTSFGIRADADVMEVVLASGRIAVAPRVAQDRMVVLEPGQMSRVARNALPATPTPVDLSEALEWTGLLIFRTAPLAEVVERLETTYEVTIDVPAELEEEGFTATFVPEQPIAQIMDAIATALGVRVEGSAGEGFRLVQDAR